MSTRISERNLNFARGLIVEAVPVSRMLRDNLRDNRLDSEGRLCCPFHDESTPSFHYSDIRKRGNCFGCHVGGTVVELYMHLRRLEMPAYSQIQAIRQLSRTYNIELPDLMDSTITNSNRVKKSVRERGAHREEFYLEKIKHIPKHSLQAPVPVRVEVSRTLDNIYLGNITAREGYTACKNLLGM